MFLFHTFLPTDFVGPFCAYVRLQYAFISLSQTAVGNLEREDTPMCGACKRPFYRTPPFFPLQLLTLPLVFSLSKVSAFTTRDSLSQNP